MLSAGGSASYPIRRLIPVNSALNCFVTDGRLPLDNNFAERQQRPIDLGRKNWLFIASEDGGPWASDLLTAFQAC